MEANWRWMLVTAVAPVAWGSNYFATRQLLPADAPLWGAAIRALPAGMLLLAIARDLPRRSWWWRSAVLGVLNVGAFFVLIYLAAQLLPTSVAAAVMATSPVALLAFAWAFAAERPTIRLIFGAAGGILGVLLILATPPTELHGGGVLASFAAMVMSSLGYVLTKRWSDGTPVLSSTAWQLVAGGVALLVTAVVVEGRPPRLDGIAVAGFAFVSLVATALAFACWFAGLAHLRAGTVGVIGLLNPVTGVLLGTLVAAEPLTWPQRLGMLLVLLAVLTAHQARSRGPGRTGQAAHRLRSAWRRLRCRTDARPATPDPAGHPRAAPAHHHPRSTAPDEPRPARAAGCVGPWRARKFVWNIRYHLKPDAPCRWSDITD
jgi:probable blue pigment (indigoidine) exporter